MSTAATNDLYEFKHDRIVIIIIFRLLSIVCSKLAHAILY